MQPNLHPATRPIVMPPGQFCNILVLSKEPAAAAGHLYQQMVQVTLSKCTATLYRHA